VPDTSLALFLEGFILGNSLDMFVSGQVPQELNNNVQLIIPNVLGSSGKGLNLYTHGFNY